MATPSSIASWQDQLGVVDTIYEDDEEDEDAAATLEDEEEDGCRRSSSTADYDHLSFTTPSPPNGSSPSDLLPPSPPPPPPPPESSSSAATLRQRVDAWSRATGCKPDVCIRVSDRCFHLHKEPLKASSGYFARRLKESSDVTFALPPPPPAGAEPITEEVTFSKIAAFCYGGDIAITPASFAAIRVAAERLEMAGEKDDDDDEEEDGGLLWLTDEYFRREIVGEPESAAVVLRACVDIILKEEKGGSGTATASAIAARCLAALADGGGDVGWLDGMAALPEWGFLVIAEALRDVAGDEDHDILYRIVDHYLQKQEKKLTEEEKSRISSTVDSTKLSPRLLVHLVQNPRMPLRFIVQAMLVDQLHTRHSLFYHHHHSSAAAAAASAGDGGAMMTLGAFLKRDAAFQKGAQLRAAMEATRSRIDGLELELAALRRKLRSSSPEEEEETRRRRRAVAAKQARSESARFFGKVGDFGDDDDEEWPQLMQATPPPQFGRPGGGGERGRSTSSLGRKLMDGLKSMFGSYRANNVGRNCNNMDNAAVDMFDQIEEELQLQLQRHRRNP